MAKTDFFMVGAEKRQDQLIMLSATNYLLIFGFCVEDGQGYNHRKYYDHKPSVAELKADIEGIINEQTERTILTGFVWRPNAASETDGHNDAEGIRVWLSQENQLNFKAAYDLAVQTGGASLPVKFKLGERAEALSSGKVWAEGKAGAEAPSPGVVPVYYVFDDMEEFTEFYTEAIGYINRVLNEGWQEKDGVDYEKLLAQAQRA